ncbi:hypothetical protein F4801DRAFT_408643 [Xylaria longipes]|nr:hypothetical protein F4801DRAFT_408643 [Xylaria longipes]
MESSRDVRSTRPALAPSTTGYSTEPTPTRVINAGDANEYARISQEHQEHPDEITPTYLLEWTDTEVTKTHIDNAAQLRSCIQDDGNYMRHLFVFHGLPVDHGVVLKEAVDIDTSFIEAHTGRRSYRPLKRMKAGWSHYDYPELGCQSSVLDDRRHEPASRDLVGDPPTYITSGTEHSVVFCRASIWLSEKAHILFLDRAAWANSKSGVSRRRYKAYTTEKIPDESGISTVTMQIDASGNTTILGDEIPDLETMLCDNLQDDCSSREDLLELLENIALNKWGDFFEALDTDLAVASGKTAALFSQTLCCLERNLDVSHQRYRMARRAASSRLDTHALPDTRLQSTTMEWEALLSRLGRRAQLSSHISPLVAGVKVPVRKPSAKIDDAAGLGTLSANGHRNNCNHKLKNNYNIGTNSSGQPDENQRALNRVAYLGGILLPFSVVSGILAIEEPFGPGNSQFWVFWAVTVPLIILTLAVIYADSIRKAEVWMEVAAASGKSDSEDTDSSPGRVPMTPDVEQAMPIPRLAEPITISLADDASGVENAGAGEPDRIVEKRWGNSAAAFNDAHPGSGESHWAQKKRWRKEELGWMGAFATMFQLYKLKTGVPPEHLRHG